LCSISAGGQFIGKNLGTAYSVSYTDTFSHHATLQLSKGDQQVRLFLKEGAVWGDGRLFSSFVGILMEEDLF
jgi:hypothetical protein